MMRHLLIILFLILPFVSQSAIKQKSNIKSNKMESTDTAIEDGINANMDNLRAMAEHGDSKAQWILGEAYRDGILNLPKDYSEANKWFLRSANQGNPKGELNIGLSYLDGRGVPEDEHEGIKWIQRAANHGDGIAQGFIGANYLMGKYNFSKDYTKAFILLRASADKGGLSKGEYLLGTCYYNGKGVVQNYSQAIKWFRKAAMHGDGEAQYALGTMYTMHIGVKKDIPEAYVWLSLAASSGEEFANIDFKPNKARDMLANALPTETLNRAQDRAKKLQEQINVYKFAVSLLNRAKGLEYSMGKK